MKFRCMFRPRKVVVTLFSTLFATKNFQQNRNSLKTAPTSLRAFQNTYEHGNAPKVMRTPALDDEKNKFSWFVKLTDRLIIYVIITG